MVVQEPFTESRISDLAAEFEARSAEDLIVWTLKEFGADVAISTSLQAEGMVILDMATRIDPAVRVFTIDTSRLPEETYSLMDRVRDTYGVEIEVYYPDPVELEQMVVRHGINLFYRSPSLRLLCCDLRKVKPLDRVLGGLDAWIAGLRRAQTQTRANVAKVELDGAHGGIVKVNPLADWSQEQVWEYIRRNDVPYNELYDRGYTSIGCAPCTRAALKGEDPRAGRWWWESGVAKECGMHLKVKPTSRANGR